MTNPANGQPDLAAHRPLPLTNLKTYDLASRPSKVFHDDLGKPVAPDASVGAWLDGLPRQLGANDLRRVANHLARARREGRTVACALGGHVIKTGCAPYLIDWIRQGLIGKQERHIPLARVQDVRLEQGVVHRVFGVVKVDIETAGGSGAEASLSVLSVAEAERLRGAVFARAPGFADAGGQAAEAPAPAPAADAAAAPAADAAAPPAADATVTTTTTEETKAP